MRGHTAVGVVATGLALLLAGCQDGIIDIGAVSDDALDDPAAVEGLVNGMSRTLSNALNLVAFTGSAIAFEATASGSQGVAGISLLQREGILDPAEVDDHWREAQQARWTAEDGVARMRRVLGDDFDNASMAARALLYVGFSNRLLGENMCQGVIDGGPPVSRDVYLERAEAAFTEAAEISRRAGVPALEQAALAGRASVRADRSDWVGARADAEAVPDTVRFVAVYSANSLDQYNRIYWGNANEPYRNLSVWGTYYEDYYTESGDERVAWTTDPEYPEGEAGVPWYVPLKYQSRGAPIVLVGGGEMHLIIAEAALQAGDVAGAMAEVNALRSEAGVAPRSVATEEAAWSALKRERGIELWLEGRRLGDLHRWLGDGTPGEAEDMTGRSTCFPIGRSESATNPNVP